MILFVSALAGVLALLGFTGLRVTRSAAALGRASLVARGQAYRAAYELKTGLIRLALLLGQYERTGDAALRETFLEESDALGRWWEQRQTEITPAARATLGVLSVGMDRGLEEMRDLVRAGNLAALTADLKARAFGAPDALPRMALTDAMFAQAQRFDAERELGGVQASLDWLRTWSVAATLLVAVLVIWLGVFLWHELIEPLRLRVIAGDRLIRRHEKLSTLGRFAAGVAHEIRNPLNSIKARLYAQSRSLSDGSAAHEDNRVISEEVIRLEQIVQDFLAFARPPEPRLETIRASEPLHAAAELLRPELEAGRIRLALDVGEDPLLRADAAQLRQVLVNLIRNARESLVGGGQISVSCRRRQPRRGPPGPAQAEIEVRDTGPGIPREIEARLFEPFFTTKSNGSGLGLSIVAQIIEAHAGRIECETQLNVGTTFRILLPVATDHADLDPSRVVAGG
jgi:signal transduction histidine kinase